MMVMVVVVVESYPQLVGDKSKREHVWEFITNF